MNPAVCFQVLVCLSSVISQHSQVPLQFLVPKLVAFAKAALSQKALHITHTCIPTVRHQGLVNFHHQSSLFFGANAPNHPNSSFILGTSINTTTYWKHRDDISFK